MINHILRVKLAVEMERRRLLGLKLVGHTYPHREAIKEQGGIWDPKTNSWLMPNKSTALLFADCFDETHQHYIINRPTTKRGGNKHVQSAEDPNSGKDQVQDG